MLLVKRLLLSSSALLTTGVAVQAADLPMTKAAPIEYVRVCGAYGKGFFFIPGTDTCLRISGRARYEYLNVPTSKIRTGTGGDTSESRALMRLNLDARTQTAYGTLRAFVRLDVASFLGNQSVLARARQGLSIVGLGADAYNRAFNFVNVDKAFIQFAGLTAGRASSFFDFYAHDFDMIGAIQSSDVYSTNLLAYTATFGTGLSATLSVEDPTNRRQPIFGTGAAVGAFNPASGFAGFNATFNGFGAGTFLAPIVVAPGVVAFQDVTQKNRMPDFVGVLRYDGGWGSAQFSAAVHEINGGNAVSTVTVGNAATSLLGVSPVGRAPNEYGWAVQGGLKVNLPMIAPGDALYLQGAYGEGAMSYTGYQYYSAPYDGLSTGIQVGSGLTRYFADAVLNPSTGHYELSTSFTATASLLHYWTPEWRSAFYANYGEADFGSAGRNALALLGFGFPRFTGTAASRAALAASSTLRDAYQITAGASLIWSPVKDLDIGVEGAWIRGGVKSGLVQDSTNPFKLISKEDNAQARFRVQRDF
ncbi:porin [Methylobacterium sp. NEAU K]|uniref:porin n=1 Tax=Methylobacterium sp. NEAU K TaxID=3064946 RepID=UPI002734E22F|nr:porin [Methylobacterium sp. NEAU K]MDP4003540.1 porin [Methylobacterium sp. NEAU K]